MWFLRLALLVIGLTLSAPADAHDVGLSRGEYSVSGAVVTATLTFARRDVDPANVAGLADAMVVHGDGAPCPSKLVSASPFETDGTRVVVQATCPSTPTRIEVEALFLASLPFGHRHLVHVGSPPVDATLTISKRSFDFAPRAPSPVGFLGMGLEHILTGVDHLVFLLGLVIVGGRLRDTVVVITAFTLGHSLSLALATFGVFVPNPRIIEPLIALSIAYVGVENLFAPHARTRWRVALPFGLVHGFGFASALREIAVPRAELPVALALFNVGVELGQIAVLLPLLPLLSRAQRDPQFSRIGVRVVSVGIALAGLVWFVLRVRGL